MARILCAWSPTWAIDNWRRRHPLARPDVPSVSSLRADPPPPLRRGGAKASRSSPACGGGGGEADGGGASPPPPFALVETARGVRRLAAVSLEAARLGLYPSQKATDALALVPDLAVAEAEPEADAAALTALVDWCVRFSPAVAADGADGLFLDIEGVSHLWDGEAGMLADLKARLADNGLSFRMAVADTPGAAWGLAHFGEDGAIAPPEGQAEALRPLPPAALRLAPDDAGQIERLGLRTLGQLMDLPRAPLAKRFGKAAVLRLDQALGQAREALSFRRPPTPWFARLALAEPISTPDDMARLAHDICAKLCARLELEGRGARRFELTYHRLDGKALSVAIGLSLPGREAPRIAKLFIPRLDVLDPGFGIEVVTLTAHEVETVAGRQGRLDAARAAAPEDGFAPLIDRLTNRLGEGRVWRAVANESHVPELAVARRRPLSASPAARSWDPETPRPLRLFARPEPLENVVALTPDDPPRQFSWRGQLRRVRRAEGPERIGEEWWKGDIDDVCFTHVRDYYRVEDQDGGRFWLFRAGLYEPSQTARWWLHGLFG